MTATSFSFLEVFGLPTLFSLNYLCQYQESCQVGWRVFHAWSGFGMLSLCLLYLFITSLLFVAFPMRHTLSIPAPWEGVPFQAPLKGKSLVIESRLSLGLILEPWEGWIVMSSMLTPCQTNWPKRALTSMCMEVTYKCRLLGLSLLLGLVDFAHRLQLR